MKVYNLTNKTLDYRGRLISPSGGWVEIPELTFIPNRDLKLRDEGYLSFGSLPDWWHPPNLIPVEEKLKATVVDEVVKKEEVKVKLK